MMKQQQKNRVSALILICALMIGTLYFYSNMALNQPPGDVPSTTDPVTNETYSFSMYQSLHLTYSDGSDTWYYPKTRTLLSHSAEIIDNGKQVNTMQANIIFDYKTTKTVDQIQLSFKTQLSLFSFNKTWIKDFAKWTTITKTLNSPLKDQAIYVTSATMDANSFQELWVQGTVPPFVPKTTAKYYYVVQIKDITAIISYTDGIDRIVKLTGTQPLENQLWWNFGRTVEYSSLLEIVSLGVEWEGR